MPGVTSVLSRACDDAHWS